MPTFDKHTPIRLLWFYFGLTVMTFGYALIIKPGLGAAPWDIFHLGLQGRTGLPLGVVIQLTGVAIILLNLTLGIRPTLGMLLNMLSVGPLLQLMLPLLPVPGALTARWVMLAAGILMTGIGTALYVSADIGSGPRDGMMIGVTRRVTGSVGLVKNAIDLTVALLGWWLGGPLGLGTVVVALALGPSVQLGMELVAGLAKYPPFTAFVRPVILNRR